MDMELDTKQSPANNPCIHILMVSFSAQGHINLMLRFAKLLQSKGGRSIHVTLATTEPARHQLLKHSSAAAVDKRTAALSISGINLQFFSDGLSLDFDRTGDLDKFMDSLAEFGPINLSNLVKRLHHQTGSPKISHIIANPFVPWVAGVAAELGIPCSMLWIQPCSLFSIYYHFLNKLKDFPTLENPEISVQLPGLPLMNPSDLPSLVLPSNPLRSVTKSIVETFENMKNFRWVFANSFYELEKDAIDAISSHIPIKPVGPLIPVTLLGEDRGSDVGVNMWKAEDACLDWLDQRPDGSVIYVAFGSLAVLAKAQTESIATALKNSKMGFIWVVKPPDSQAADGAGEVPEGFLEETREQGMVVPWCHQGLVLSHRSIACFLTHCGWNSLLEAVSAGVPLIGFPQWNDQPTNAKLLAEAFGVGVRVRVCPNEDGQVASQQFEKCIQEVVSGPRAAEYRGKAMEWKQAARDAVADGGSSDRIIKSFLDDIAKC